MAHEMKFIIYLKIHVLISTVCFHFFLQFYIAENNLETLARQMLFLSLALEPKESLGLQGNVLCNVVKVLSYTCWWFFTE